MYSGYRSPLKAVSRMTVRDVHNRLLAVWIFSKLTVAVVCVCAVIEAPAGLMLHVPLLVSHPLPFFEEV